MTALATTTTGAAADGSAVAMALSGGIGKGGVCSSGLCRLRALRVGVCARPSM